ncbi:MAG: cbb3-type cytochrome c oxidase subunit I [Anaerolineae bacterium]|nr:cbb3-type cytochrome c oxidase subunit I [Anaerolineae bacterium]
MPKLSVWLVRASLIHMGIGFLFGALILHQKGIPIYTWSWRLLNPHIELMVFGWTIQFVMGIAFWILPRFSGEQRYGKVYLGWWSLGMLNSGIVLTATGLWFATDLVALVGRLSTLGAVFLFVILIWPRVKPLGGYAASQSS